VHSVIALCDRKFPGQGAELSKLWRTKQLEYTWLRSLVGRYEDFWSVTESALTFACRCLSLECPPETRQELMESYLHLETFPEMQATLSKLSQYKCRAVLKDRTGLALFSRVSGQLVQTMRD